jgi:site-specific DNA recombinase
MKPSNRNSEAKANDTSTPIRRRLRCAIYTRKSSEDGLEQEFNSLDAQREACEAYILSQKNDGWVALPTFYDDGGLSGGTLERPALKRLLDDVSAGRVDIIVVYKVDRLTRSLADFARIVDTLDKHQVSFVSVTQHFNTTSSMGRLTLNVLLSFAQFEREIAGERIRDKIAASKRKGMWMGGTIPFGYEVKDRKLEVVETEAETLRLIFSTYAELGTVDALMERLAECGITNQSERAKQRASQPTDYNADQPTAAAPKKAANLTAPAPTPFGRAALHHMLKNPLYIGKTTHKGQVFDGMHLPIIDTELWQQVQLQITDNTNNRTSGRRSKNPSLLIGLIETEDGQVLTPTHAVKNGVRYRYYANFRAAPKGKAKAKVKVKVKANAKAKTNSCQQTSTPQLRRTLKPSQPILRIPAAAIERLVTDRLLTMLRSPTELADLLQPQNLTASQLQNAIQTAHELADRWHSKAAADQRGILQTVLIKVCLHTDHVDLHLSRRGLMQILVRDAASSIALKDPETKPTAGEIENDIAIIQTTNGLEPSGNGLRLIIKDTGQAEPNMQLAPLIGEAFMFREALLSGPCDSIEDVSKAFQMGKRHVTARIRLTYLSPKLIRNFLNGDVPNTLSPTRLLEASKDLPMKWADQDSFIIALAR